MIKRIIFFLLSILCTSIPHSLIASDNIFDEKGKREALGFLALSFQRSKPIIKTEHLFIAPFHESDIAHYIKIQENEFSTPGRHFHQFIRPEVLQSYANFIKDPETLLYDSSYPFRPYSVFLLDPEDKWRYKTIGFFTLSPLINQTGNAYLCYSEIQYIIDRAYQGKGYGKEMLKAVTSKLIPPLLGRKYSTFANYFRPSNEPLMPFRQLGALIDIDNIASIKVALKSGFIAFDLIIDRNYKEGEGYQIDFIFPKPMFSRISSEVTDLIKELPNARAREKLIQNFIKQSIIWGQQKYPK